MIHHLPGETEIVTGVTAAALKYQPLGNNPRTLGPHEMPGGWRWIRPDYFLLPAMSVIQAHDAFRNISPIPIHQGHENDDAPIPPLREEIADYLSEDYVSRNCWFERTVDGFTFKLKLPISGGQRELEARKAYRFADLHKIESFDIPVTEIWPSTKLPGWKCWYTFWAIDEERNRLYLRPCKGAGVVPARNTLERATREQVTLTREAPGYLACFELKDRQNGIELEPLGLVMPSFLESPRNAMPRNFSVGFDFGTTNTHIFLAGGAGTPLPLTIKPETVRIFNNEEKKREGLMYRLFVPSLEDKAPFLSLLRRRVEPAGGFEALRDAHVLFYHQQVEGAQFEDHAVEAYLKWHPELNDDRNAFLTQLVLHAAYEARLQGANRLKFIYSYPTAFDESTHEILAAFWSSDVPGLSGLIGVECERPDRQTESIATACYFNQISPGENALLGTGAMVLDIGGGTTDISAWRKNRLEIQTSVRLSGREILLIPMEQKKSYVLEMLKQRMDDGETIFKPLETLDGDRFYRRADAILRAHGDTLLGRLKSLMGTEKFDRFRSEIAIRLTALLYYSGLLLRRTKWFDSGSRLPDLYIGGNGSRVLHWLAPPNFDENRAAVPLLMAAYAGGAGVDKVPSELKLVLSRQPKSEVACGLVYSVRKPLAQPDEAIQTVSGESFETGSQAYAETDVLTPALLRGGLRVTGALEIANMLKIYNEFADRPGAILSPIVNIAQIVGRAIDEMNEWAEKQTKEDMKGISVAPVFITGVVNSLPLVEWRAAATHAVSS